MSALEFVASLVSSLAWPVGAVVVVWILRREIQDLVGRIRSIDYKGARIEIDRLAAAARSVTPGSPTKTAAINRAVERTGRGSGLMPADLLRDLRDASISGLMLTEAGARFLEHTITNAAADVLEPMPEHPFDQLAGLARVVPQRP